MKLLCKRSSFFRSYFSRAADPYRLDLPNGQPATFAVLAQWMYQEKLPQLNGNSTTSPSFGEVQDLLALYYMAFKFCLRGLQDDTLARIVDDHLKVREDNPMDLEYILRIYRNTDPGSPLRLFAVDALAYSFLDRDLDASWDLRPLFLEFPDLAGDFVDAVREIHIGGQDFMATRAEHRRYVH